MILNEEREDLFMYKFKIGEIVICNNDIHKIEDISELGYNGTQYLLDDGNWYNEAEMQ